MRSFSTYVAHDANQPDQITWNPLSNHESHKRSEHIINLTEVFRANHLFSQSDIVEETALIHSPRLSQEYEANIFLKREDHQRGTPPPTQAGPSRFAAPTSSTSLPTSRPGRRAS
jgi:hypothetical protein